MLLTSGRALVLADQYRWTSSHNWLVNLRFSMDSDSYSRGLSIKNLVVLSQTTAEVGNIASLRTSYTTIPRA